MLHERWLVVGDKRETGNWPVVVAGQTQNQCRAPRVRVLRRDFGYKSQATGREAHSASVRAAGMLSPNCVRMWAAYGLSI